MYLDDKSDSEDSPSMPIRNSKSAAVFFACTDTWVIGVICLLLFTLGMTIYMLIIESKPSAPGGEFRVIATTISVWLVFGALVTPRFISSYTIARHGYYLLSKVRNHEDFGLGKRASTRLNVTYIKGGKRYLAKASVLGKIPANGSDILVAVHPKKPYCYRVLPYDYLLSRWARLAVIDKIRQTQDAASNAT